MIRLAVLAILASLTAMPSGAHAQSKQLYFKPLNDRKASPSKSEKSRRTACSEYGAGFYRMEGSDTCVRIGGGIDVTVSSGRGFTDAPTR
jgi:hypothetical protein